MRDTKSRILDVAIRLFAVGSFNSVSVRDIAVEAGVNVALINYHFKSKEALYQMCVFSSIDAILMEPAIFEDRNKSIDQALTELYSLLVSSHRKHNYGLILHDRELANPKGRFRAEFFDKICQRHLQLIEWLQNKGVPASQSTLLSYSLIGIGKFALMSEDFRQRMGETFKDPDLVRLLVNQGISLIEGAKND